PSIYNHRGQSIVGTRRHAEARPARRQGASPLAWARGPPFRGFPRGRRGKRSERETSANHRSSVVLVQVRDAGAVRNSDGHTAAHVGIRNSGKNVETLGEVMIRVERNLVEEARAGSAV